MDNPLLLTPEELAVLCQQNKAVGSMIVTSILLFIAIITVSLRLYVCIAIRRSTSWDDYFIVASLISGLVAFGLFSKLFVSGMGRHIVCLTLAQVSETAKWSLFSQIFISISLGLTKISVCIFVLRIIDKAQRRFSQFLWVLIAFVTVTHIIQFVLFLVQCRPLEAVWNPFVRGNCFSINAVYLVSYINYSLDCFSDFTKIALCILMGLGVFTAICVLISAVTLRGVFDHDFPCKYPSPKTSSCDTNIRSGGITTPGTWAGIGAFVGITIASLPALKRLFTLPDSIKSLFSRSRSRKRSSDQAFRHIHGRDEALRMKDSDSKNGVEDPERGHSAES